MELATMGLRSTVSDESTVTFQPAAVRQPTKVPDRTGAYAASTWIQHALASMAVA
jgi:hypothetical protein